MIRIKPFFLFILCCLFTSFSFAQWNPEVDTENRFLSNFDQIVVKGAADVFIQTGTEEEVLVESGKNVFTTVEDGVLLIKTKRGKKSGKTTRIDGGDVESSGGKIFGSFFNPKNWGQKSPKIYITIKQIHSLTVSGATDLVSANVISAEKMVLNCSGASDMEMQLEVSKLTCNMSGASDIKLSGSVDQISIKASGASDFKSKNLVVQECYAKASGASDIFVNVEKKLTYETSGASDIHYEGNPEVHNLKAKAKKPRT